MKDSISGTRIIRNATSLTAAEILTRIINFAFLAVATRKLGVAGFGLYGTLLTFLFISRSIGTLGLQRVIVREVSQNKDQVDIHLSSGVACMLPVAVLLWISLPLLAGVLDYDQSVQNHLWILGIALFTNAFTRPLEGIIRAFERMRMLGYIRIIISLFVTVTGILALFAGFGLTVLISLQAIGSILELILLNRFVRKSLRAYLWNPSRSLIAFFFRESALVGIIAASNMLLNNVDILMLAHLKTPEDTGLYIACVRLIRYASLIRLGASGAMFPAMAATWRTSGEQFHTLFTESIRAFSIYSFFIALLLSLGGKEILSLLFGSSFQMVATTLTILSWAMVLETISGPFTMSIVITRRNLPAFLTFALCMVGTNIGLNVLLIPKYSYTGAAIATLITSLLFFVGKILWTRDQFPNGIPLSFSLLGKPLLASIIVAVLFMLFGNMSFWVKVIPSCVLYFLLLTLTSGIKNRDFSRLLESAGLTRRTVKR